MFNVLFDRSDPRKRGWSSVGKYFSRKRDQLESTSPKTIS